MKKQRKPDHPQHTDPHRTRSATHRHSSRTESTTHHPDTTPTPCHTQQPTEPTNLEKRETLGVKEVDKNPASRLIEIARDKKILLPLSSAHMIETGATFNTKRQNLAATILELSRGWTMRHPIDVRQAEIVEVFSRRYGAFVNKPEPVFTCDSNALYSKKRYQRRHGYAFWEKFPVKFQHLLECLVGAIGTYDTLMDPERIDPGESIAWVAHYNQLAQELKKDKNRPKRRREMALLATVVDVKDEIAIAAAVVDMSHSQLEEWFMEHRGADLASMPFLGLYADAIAFRLCNPDVKWHSNDLFDGLFLCCATAYADVVGADRAATEYIRRSWRDHGGTPPIVATLAELVDLVEDLISQPTSLGNSSTDDEDPPS